MVGLSYGGTSTLFLAAWDERIRAAVVSGYFSEWRESHRVPWNLCGSQVLPGMLGELEHVDLGALIAPRPLLVETGTDDPIFPVAGARREMAPPRHRLRAARRARATRARRVRRRPPLERRPRLPLPRALALIESGGKTLAKRNAGVTDRYN